MLTTRFLTLIGGVALLLLLDVMTRRARYYNPQARPLRAALVGAFALALAWIVAAYFRPAGLHSQQVIEAVVLSSAWFLGALVVGVMLRRSAARAGQRRK